MIEIILIVLAGLALITLIYVLVQYGLKLEQNRLKQEQEQRNLEHQTRLANGYKWYEWKGYITRIYYDPYSYYSVELYRMNLNREGSGYFKSEKDLEHWLNASNITLTWCREL